MSTAASASSDDDGFTYGESNVQRRYPVHDCCEFEDAEALKRLIFVRQDDSDDDSSSSSGSSDGDDDSSSSDDSNDSHQAALSAAIGHSPLPVPASIPAVRNVGIVPTNIGTIPNTESQSVPESRMHDKESGGPADTSAEGSDQKPSSPKQTLQDSEKEDKNMCVLKEDRDASVPTNMVSNDVKGRDVSPSSDEAESAPCSPSKQDARDKADVLPVSATSVVLGSGLAKEEGAVAESVSAAVAMDISPDASRENPLSAEHDVAPMEKKADSEGPNGVSNQKSLKKSKTKSSVKKAKTPTFYCPYDLNERDEDENTPLHVAIHARKLEHVKLLIEAGASVHRKCDGSPPIHTAISIGAIPKHADFAYQCVIVLTEHGADLSARDDAMHSPLYLACMMNMPRVVSYILTKNDSIGLSTLNARSDRAGGRPLHAAAKFDLPLHPSHSSHPHARVAAVHHPDGTLAHTGHHHVPGFHRLPAESNPSNSQHSPSEVGGKARNNSDSTGVVTQVLLSTPSIEVDPKNSYGQTPLHIACSRGNWPVVRLLLQSGANPHIADRRGFTPGQLAHKRGMPIPNELLSVLGEAPSSCHVAPPRDLIVDPDSSSFFICHELCSLHRTCPPIRRDTNSEPPPENVRRLHVLINEDDGILRGGEFARCSWEGEARRAAMADVLKVHEYSYVESISQMISSIPDHPSAIAHLDADTAVSRWSFEAAMRAAGSVCEAVDRVVAGDFRNAFCAVRPPGHHAGPRGIVRCANDPEGGSHGFCLLNNVAIGAAYARSMYRNHDIRKIAIIDFDVHHGNGTEEVVRQLVPQVEKSLVRTPFAVGELQRPSYRPWLDETDVQDVLFASTHGYGPRGHEFAEHPTAGGWFYPASGKTQTTDAILNPSSVESPSTTDFLLSQTWTRMGEDSRVNCCKVINCGLGLPEPHAIPGMQRVELRDAYRKNILPHLREFDPDIIFISAGFDGHKRDAMNFGYVGMVEDDYEWVTEQLVKVANTCCSGRIVSVLEGGYKIHGGIVSPFARSVASHVRALVDGGKSRELYDPADGEWDSQFEKHMVEDRERRRQQKIERLHRAEEESRRQQYEHHRTAADEAALMQEPLKDHSVEHGENSNGADQPSRKRRRNQVDYRELYEQMKREGFSG